MDREEAMTNVIVSTGEVAAMLGKPGVRLIEVSMDREAYASGHIAGALDIDWQRQLIEEEDESSGKVIDPERFGALARRLGLDINDSLVFYGDQGGRHAARALWTFEYYRHRGSLHWMDGGREKWLSEGRPMTAETQPLVPSAYPVPSARQPNMRITLDEIRSQLGRPSMSVLDVRTEEEYEGADVRAARGGHIPGAAHVFWEDALQPDKSLRPKSELAELYRDVPRDATVAVHCQLGVRAAHTWLVLRHLLGYDDVRNCDGSWQEWGNREDVPVE
jgi:thiosulfate/3-mercaptopyruvate sulfurtransferase